MGAKEFFSSLGNNIKSGLQKVAGSLPSIASAVIDGASNGGIMGAVSGGVKSIMSVVTGVSKSEPSQTVANSTSSSSTVSKPVAVSVSVTSNNNGLSAYELVTQRLRRTI